MGSYKLVNNCALLYWPIDDWFLGHTSWIVDSCSTDSMGQVLLEVLLLSRANVTPPLHSLFCHSLTKGAIMNFNKRRSEKNYFCATCRFVTVFRTSVFESCPEPPNSVHIFPAVSLIFIFAKRIVTNNLFASVRPPAYVERLGSHDMEFREILYWRFLIKFIGTFQFLLKLTLCVRTCLHIWILWLLTLSLLLRLSWLPMIVIMMVRFVTIVTVVNKPVFLWLLLLLLSLLFNWIPLTYVLVVTMVTVVTTVTSITEVTNILMVAVVNLWPCYFGYQAYHFSSGCNW
jgi:hypothetical protein